MSVGYFRHPALDKIEQVRRKQCKAKSCTNAAAYHGEYCHHCWRARQYQVPSDHEVGTLHMAAMQLALDGGEDE